MVLGKKKPAKKRRSSLEVAQDKSRLLEEKLKQKHLAARLEAAERLYDAAKVSNYRKPVDKGRSGDAVMNHAGEKLRDYARYLDENHDLAIGVLDALVNRIVGTGITVQHMAKASDGTLHEGLNEQLADLWRDWVRKPEVTGELPWAELLRIVCRAWLRDGEILIQHVLDNKALDHLTRVPYSLELIEADFLPFDLNDKNNGVIHGVKKNTWGRVQSYYLYKEHPGNVFFPYISANDIKEVQAENITHLKFVRRVRQTRGVSILHGVITRLDDLRDYEESERIAARVAAAFTGFIKKSTDVAGANATSDGTRTFEMAPGMIFDDLLPGEEIGTIGTDRPNSNLGNFRNDMLRAVAGGTGTSFSTISKKYEGSYSSQRQELVESKVGYDRLFSYFVETFVRPVYEKFVETAYLTGQLKLDPSVDRMKMNHAEFVAPAMPWIDPKKEIEADQLAVESRFKSRAQIIRERGGDPEAVRKQLLLENEQDKADGVTQEPVQQELDMPEPDDMQDDDEDMVNEA